MDVISLTIMYVATFTVGQEAVSRYYAARDGKAARQGSVLAAIVNFIYAFVPTLMGIIVLALINMGKFNAADLGCWCPLCTSGSCYGSNAGNYLRIVVAVSYLPQCQVLTQTFLVPDRSLQMIFTRL